MARRFSETDGENQFIPASSSGAYYTRDSTVVEEEDKKDDEPEFSSSSSTYSAKQSSSAPEPVKQVEPPQSESSYYESSNNGSKQSSSQPLMTSGNESSSSEEESSHDKPFVPPTPSTATISSGSESSSETPENSEHSEEKEAEKSSSSSPAPPAKSESEPEPEPEPKEEEKKESSSSSSSSKGKAEEESSSSSAPPPPAKVSSARESSAKESSAKEESEKHREEEEKKTATKTESSSSDREEAPPQIASRGLSDHAPASAHEDESSSSSSSSLETPPPPPPQKVDLNINIQPKEVFIFGDSPDSSSSSYRTISEPPYDDPNSRRRKKANKYSRIDADMIEQYIQKRDTNFVTDTRAPKQKVEKKETPKYIDRDFLFASDSDSDESTKNEHKKIKGRSKYLDDDSDDGWEPGRRKSKKKDNKALYGNFYDDVEEGDESKSGKKRHHKPADYYAGEKKDPLSLKQNPYLNPDEDPTLLEPRLTKRERLAKKLKDAMNGTDRILIPDEDLDFVDAQCEAREARKMRELEEAEARYSGKNNTRSGSRKTPKTPGGITHSLQIPASQTYSNNDEVTPKDGKKAGKKQATPKKGKAQNNPPELKKVNNFGSEEGEDTHAKKRRKGNKFGVGGEESQGSEDEANSDLFILRKEGQKAGGKKERKVKADKQSGGNSLASERSYSKKSGSKQYHKKENNDEDNDVNEVSASYSTGKKDIPQIRKQKGRYDDDEDVDSATFDKHKQKKGDSSLSTKSGSKKSKYMEDSDEYGEEEQSNSYFSTHTVGGTPEKRYPNQELQPKSPFLKMQNSHHWSESTSTTFSEAHPKYYGHVPFRKHVDLPPGVEPEWYYEHQREENHPDDSEIPLYMRTQNGRLVSRSELERIAAGQKKEEPSKKVVKRVVKNRSLEIETDESSGRHKRFQNIYLASSDDEYDLGDEFNIRKRRRKNDGNGKGKEFRFDSESSYNVEKRFRPNYNDDPPDRKRLYRQLNRKEVIEQEGSESATLTSSRT